MPAVLVDQRNDPLEQPVERRDDVGRVQLFGERGEAADVDEHHRHLDFLARQRCARTQDVVGDVTVDVGAEHIADAFAFGKTRGHGVETCLQAADFAGVVDDDAGAEVAGLHLGQRHAQRPDPLAD